MKSILRLNIHSFLDFKDKPARYLVPYESGNELEVKLDYRNNQFTVLDPYTEIQLEKINRSKTHKEGLPFFRCPKCNERVQHMYVNKDENEVCCRYCMQLKEILENEKRTN